MMASLRIAFAALVAISCASIACAQSVIKADGSSTVYPVTEAVGRAFQVASRGTTRVLVGISGTRGGFRKFCTAQTDLQDASRPILAEEIEVCRTNGVRYFELPVAFDGITVAVNRRNTWANALTVAQLRKIWEPQAERKIMRWSDIDRAWPNEPLVLFAPGPDSGTFEYFTEAIVGAARATRNDYLSSEDDNAIIRGIEGDVNALGYVPFSYYVSHSGSLKALAIDSGRGPVAPAIASIAGRTYAPLSRPLYLYVNADAARRAEVSQFIEFLLEDGAPLIREASYLPLAQTSYSAALEYFRRGKPDAARKNDLLLQVDSHR